MDFARPLRLEEGVATKSNIRYIYHSHSTTDEPPAEGNDEYVTKKSSLDDLLIDAANGAAVDLFLGPPSLPRKRGLSSIESERGDLRLVDCRLHPDRSVPLSNSIQPGSLVVIFESFDCLDFTYVEPGNIFSNRNGHFHHDDFVGLPYGSRVRARHGGGSSRGPGRGGRARASQPGYVHLLRPTPELWTRSLNHRTQIVHELDSSFVTFKLNLRPNMMVAESGTGSGAMSHALMRTIAPGGLLHTFEFNRHRVTEARKEFHKNGVGHLVKVHWRDVCGKEKVDDTPAADGEKEDVKKSAGARDDDDAEGEEMGHGGFHPLGPASTHAVFLDLPEPWLAVPHSADVLKPDGRVCSYSPCMEQVQRTVDSLRQNGFHSVQTVEVRLREYYVDELELEGPPTTRLPREPAVQIPLPGGGVGKSPASSVGTAAAAMASFAAESDSRATSDMDGAGKSDADDATGNTTGGEADNEVSHSEVAPGEDENGDGDERGAASIRKRAKMNREKEDGDRKKKFLVARPFTAMRGHTAFLTFATRGVGGWKKQS